MSISIKKFTLQETLLRSMKRQDTDKPQTTYTRKDYFYIMYICMCMCIYIYIYAVYIYIYAIYIVYCTYKQRMKWF
jgi:hypothetical protein